MKNLSERHFERERAAETKRRQRLLAECLKAQHVASSQLAKSRASVHGFLLNKASWRIVRVEKLAGDRNRGSKEAGVGIESRGVIAGSQKTGAKENGRAVARDKYFLEPLCFED